MKTAKDYLEEANKVVKKIDVKEAIEIHKNNSAIFIDVRDSSDIAKTGSIEGSLKIQRGLIEFVADEGTEFYNDKLKKDSEIILVIEVNKEGTISLSSIEDPNYVLSDVSGLEGILEQAVEQSPKALPAVKTNADTAVTVSIKLPVQRIASAAE